MDIEIIGTVIATLIGNAAVVAAIKQFWKWWSNRYDEEARANLEKDQIRLQASIKNSHDQREFQQRIDAAASEKMFSLLDVLINDKIKTTEEALAEIKASQASGIKETKYHLDSRIDEMEKRLKFLEIASNRQTDMLTLVNQLITKLVDELGRETRNGKSH